MDVKQRLQTALQTVGNGINAQTREGSILEKSVLAQFNNERAAALKQTDQAPQPTPF